MQDKITSNTILGYLKEAVENKAKLNPDVWIDAALKLNTLLDDEYGALYDLQQEVANIRLENLQLYTDQNGKRNVSEAKLRTEATETYKLYKKQESRCKQIEEFIRIAKIQARLTSGY